MTSPGSNGGAGPAPFTQRDMETIIAIIDNQPLQNMKVARELQALQQRFVLFCTANLQKDKGGKGKGGKPDPEPNPAS